MPQTPRPDSPLSPRQREAQREAIRRQQQRGEISAEDAQAALAKLDAPTVHRG